MFWMLSPLWLVNTNVLTIFVASHSLISKVSPEWRVNPGFVTQKKCPFPLNRRVPTTEVKDTKIMWTFFRDQILCPLNGGVLWIEVFQRRMFHCIISCFPHRFAIDSSSSSWLWHLTPAISFSSSSSVASSSVAVLSHIIFLLHKCYV